MGSGVVAKSPDVALGHRTHQRPDRAYIFPLRRDIHLVDGEEDIDPSSLVSFSSLLPLTRCKATLLRSNFNICACVHIKKIYYYLINCWFCPPPPSLLKSMLIRVEGNNNSPLL